MSTIIRYYVPEDKDVEEKPNGFLVYKEIDKIRLSDIYTNFPLPGEYIFRFKTDFQQKKVWIDFSNDDAPLPLSEGKIILKVNRISWESKEKQKNSSEVEFGTDFPSFS